MISKDEVIDKLLACDDIFYQGSFWKTFNISKPGYLAEFKVAYDATRESIFKIDIINGNL
jgi:hypothetical protein